MNKLSPQRHFSADDFDQELFEIYDYYAHGEITKREFLNSAAKFAVGGLTAATLLDILSPNYALAQQVSLEDPDITATYIVYPSPNGHGEVRGYFVKPAAATGPLPAVVVVHENRGLNPYIEDVARRVAKAGFVALAPDGLTAVGGYPGTDEEGRELQRTMDRQKLRSDFFAAYEHLVSDDSTTGRVGCVGFCWGGGVCNAMAAAYSDLGASVPFYGRPADESEVAGIEAPLLLQFAEHDTRINERWPAYEAALKAHGKTYTAYVYEGANHGFHNDSTPRYAPDAANLAWDRTITFFDTHLR